MSRSSVKPASRDVFSAPAARAKKERERSERPIASLRGRVPVGAARAALVDRMNVHVIQFGQEIEEARARLLYRTLRGECDAVQAYLALFGGIALMRNGIEALDARHAEEEREAL